MKLLLTFIYITIIGQACFWIGLVLPREMFSKNKFPYKEYKWEKGGRVYNILRVKRWKARVPDMSKLTRLLFPKKLCRDMTSKDFDRLMQESCIAELSHYVLFILSFGIYQIWKGKVGIILTIVYNLVGNVPYIIIQRYNRPHFAKVRDKLKLREERRTLADC